MPLIFTTNNNILSILRVDERGPLKRLKMISPRLPLPWGFVSVDVFPAINGVQIREAGASGKILGILPCSFENVEHLWVILLPIISEAYTQGDRDGREALATEVTASLAQTDNNQPPHQKTGVFSTPPSNPLPQAKNIAKSHGKLRRPG